MNRAVASMLAKYQPQTVEDHVNAIREVIQEIALCGLWRGKFFEHAAFYGGTALRIMHGLDRFSEDMDFSLLAPDPAFNLEPYAQFLVGELAAWGFKVQVQKKRKNITTTVESAFLKANTREQLLVIDAGEEVAGTLHRNQAIRIKLEVDTDPPPRFGTDTRFLLAPIPFSVRTFDLPSFLAGKIHALLCREWGGRVKGRDWYDFVWHLGQGTALNLPHLEDRLRQTGHYQGQTPLTLAEVKQMLRHRIEQLDIEAAKRDVERFLTDPAAIKVWSRDFFLALSENLMVDPA